MAHEDGHSIASTPSSAPAQPVAPVPDDLAVDGIDELLKVFVAYSVADWGRLLHRHPRRIARPDVHRRTAGRPGEFGPVPAGYRRGRRRPTQPT